MNSFFFHHHHHFPLSLSLFLFLFFYFFGQNERGILGFPGGSETQEMQVDALVRKIPWSGK